MKVLFDNQVYQMQKFGGINRYFDELLKINKPGFEVDITNSVTSRSQVHLKTDFFSRGLRSLKRRFYQEDISNNSAVNYINTFSGLTFDIFHPTYYDTYFLNLTPKPFVLTVYDMIFEIYPEYIVHSDNPVSRNKKILCEKANKIITISETTKRDLIDIFKIPEDKVYAILLASDFIDMVPQKPANAQEFENYILFVGARDAYKNFYLPAMALAELLKNDRTLSLVCTGRSFSAGEIEFFKSLDIDKQVKHIYLQNDEELAWIYEHARVFIFPSLYEGFGLPLLEAFSKNCPVISSKGGSLTEVGGDAALYFDPKNIVEIHDAAYKALYDADIRKNLIAKGQNQLAKFSWNTCREETIEVYRNIAI